mgnify:FL=1
MIKLRTILLCNFPYYIILFIALLYFLITNFFIVYKSNYDEISSINAKIIDITIKDYGIKLTLKNKEKLIGYLYLEKEQKEEFLNNYSYGDIVYIKTEELEINNNTVENTFNYRKYLYNNKIFHVLKINYIEKVKDNKNIFYKIKNNLIKNSFKLEKSYPYINGLIFGKDDYINDDVTTSFRNIGISHLFAISGTHVSIFVLILNNILKRLKIYEEKRYIIIVLFLLFYMFLTSYPMSVLRSCIFTILLTINKRFYFFIKPQNLLYLTLAIILFINPLYIYNLGLQLSFSISLSLILMGEYINKNKTKIGKALCISFISFVVSFPIVINNFYEVNFLSIFYNLFFVPFITMLILPLTLISFIFPFLDNILHIFIFILENLTLFLSKISALKITFCKVNFVIFCLYYVLIIFCLFYLKKGKKSVVFFLLIVIIIHSNIKFINNDYVMFMDVNQGDSTLIVVNKKITLIDTGDILQLNNDKYDYNITNNRTIPYLKSKGIKKIDNLILTHGDYDHMGDAINLVNNFKVEKVIFNCGKFNDLEKELIKVLDKRKIKYYSCINELNIDNNKLYFLQTKEYDNENDNSNVIYTKINGYKFMFMGDAGVDKEKDILEKYNMSNIDVLKVGHHGSKTSSSKKFIDEINPKYGVISVGKNNKYGHPNKEILNTLSNSKIYRTDEDGSIMFKIKNNKLKIKTCGS